MYAKPYVIEEDTNLAILAQWSITLVLISTLIIRVNEVEQGSAHSAFIGIWLMLVNLFVLFFSIGTVIYESKEKGGDDAGDLFFGSDSDEGDSEDDEEMKKKDFDSKHKDMEFLGDIQLNPLGVVSAKNDPAEKQNIEEEADSDDEEDYVENEETVISTEIINHKQDSVIDKSGGQKINHKQDSVIDKSGGQKINHKQDIVIDKSSGQKSNHKQDIVIDKSGGQKIHHKQDIVIDRNDGEKNTFEQIS